MSDPIGAYLKYTKEQLGYMGQQGIDPNDPIADQLIPKDTTDQRQFTALGSQQRDAEAIQNQIATIQRVLPAAVGDRKDRLTKLLTSLQHDGGLSGAPTWGESARRFAGGVAAAVPEMFMGTADLGASIAGVAAKPLSALGVPIEGPISSLRETLHEGMAATDQLTGSQGWEGLVGQFAGTLGMGAAGKAARAIPVIGKAFALANAPAEIYGQISSATLRFLGKANMFQPAVKAAFEGNFAQRAAGQLVGDLPANVMQALTMPDANVHDIARTLAIGGAGSIVGGAMKGRESVNGKPFNADKTPPTGTPDTQAQAMADVAMKINDWQQAHPEQKWADLSDVEKGAVLGNAPKTGTAWIRLNDKGQALREYMLGEHDNLFAAQQSFADLAASGLSSEGWMSMLGFDVVNQNGVTALVTDGGMSPSPERLLLASGQAPTALQSAAEADANSTLNQPITATKMKAGSGYYLRYTWQTPLGHELELTGTPVDGKFVIDHMESSGGPGSLNYRLVRNALTQAMQLTGTTSVEGYKTAPVAGQPDAGMPPGDVSRPVSRTIPDSPDQSPTPETIAPQTGTVHPGVPPDGTETIDVMKKVQQYGLGDVARQAAADITSQLGNDQTHAHAEMGARFVVSRYEALVGEGVPAPMARNRIVSEIKETTFDPMVDRTVSSDTINRLKAQWQVVSESNEPAARRMADELYQKLESLGAFTPEDYHPPTQLTPTPEPTPPTLEPKATTPESPTLSTPSHTQELETISTPVPLKEMGPHEVSGLIDRVVRPFGLNKNLYDTPQWSAAQRDISKLNARLKVISNLPPESAFALDKPTDVSRLSDLMGTPIESMEEDERGELNVLLQNANNKLPSGDPRKDPLIDKIMELRDYQRTRAINKRTPKVKGTATEDDIAKMFYNQALQPKRKGDVRGFTSPTATAAIVAHFAGFGLGYALPADNDRDRLRNAFLGALAVGGATLGGKFYLQGKANAAKLADLARLPGEAELDKVMVTRSNGEKFAKLTPDGMIANIVSGLDKLYNNTIRPSRGREIASRMMMPGERGAEAGRIAATFAGGRREVAQWLYTGPMVQDATGAWVRRTVTRADGTVAQVPTAAEVLQHAGEDIEHLGYTATYLSALELYARDGKMPHPDLDPVKASQYIAAVDKKYIEAAQMMRDSHLALVDMQVDAGLIKPEARAKMATENFYTALERVLGDPTDMIFANRLRGAKEFIGSPTVIQSREGPNVYPIKNPVETWLFNIPRVMKAVEVNENKASFVSLYEDSPLPSELKNAFIRPTTRTQAEGADATQKERVQTLMSTIEGLTEPEARDMLAVYDPKPLGPNSTLMSFFRNGEQELWRVAPGLVNSFQYMNGYEISKIWQVLGLGQGMVRKGVTMSPDFVARMGWIDVFQSYLNSKWGGSLRDMTPGVNWIDALYKLATKNSQAQLWGGGTAEGTMMEGLYNPREIVRKAAASTGKTVFGDALNSIKDMHPVDAYKALLVPIVEAGRFSSYLSDLRHGASVQEALRTSTGSLGYYNQVGPMVAGLFHAIPFLKGNIQAMDEDIASMGLHPFREYDAAKPFNVPFTNAQFGDKARALMWGSKAMIAVALPTALMYAANYDDKEINALRRTESGRRYFFVRLPGTGIFKFRKPAGIVSDIFSTGLEIALDRANEQEPEPISQWVGAIRRDVAVPWLPPALQIGTGLATGVDMSSGNRFGGRDNMLTEQGAGRNTSQFGKSVSGGLGQVLGNPEMGVGLGNAVGSQVVGAVSRAISPAGLDYIMSTLGGTLGGESLQLADMSRSWVETGSVPAIQEWPIVRKFATIDATQQQTRDMEDFYKMVGRAEHVSNALSQSHSQGDLEGYISIAQRYADQIAVSGSLLKARTDMADEMRAVEEIKNSDGDPQYKQQTIRALRQQMQVRATLEVQAARSVMGAIQR